MAVSAARAIAFEILTRVEDEGAFAADALHSRLSSPGGTRHPFRPRNRGVIKREDAALATELTLGVLRWQRLLDFLLERQARRPAISLDAPVRRALRLGAYQLLFLDRIPPSAAVNESVELAKRARKRSATSLVNAVLRRLPRGPLCIEELASCLPAGLSKAERLAIIHSHPTWMVQRWLCRFGPERTRALLEANNRPLPVACAVLDPARAEEVTASLRQDGLAVDPGHLVSTALVVRGGSLLATRAFRKGWIVVQDEASQAVALLAGVQQGQSVLDLCAAPGNKTVHLSLAAGPKALVVAADIHRHRLRALRAQFRRVGIGGVRLVLLDASRPLPFGCRFDRILVDAPCSGTGTLARNPEIRWRLSPRDIAVLAWREATILNHALDALAPGGRLVYATCSIEPEENEQVVSQVVGARSDARVVPPSATPACLLTGAALFDAEGYFRTWPPETATDGFFAAVIERQ